VDAVECPRLVVERALGAVDVFGDLLVGFERPAAEANESAGHVPDREHHPAAVEIVERAVLALLAEPARQQPLLLIAGLPGRLGEGAVLTPRGVRAVADGKIGQGGIAEATLSEVPQADALALPGLMELLLEPFLGPGGQIGEAFAFGLLGLLLGGQLPLLDFDAVFVGEPTERLRIGELLVLHQEGHCAPPLSGAEILKDALARDHVEGRCLLVGERTQPAHARPALLELNELTDHLFDDGGLHDGVDGVLRDHGGEKRKGKVGLATRPPRPADNPESVSRR